MNYKHIKVLSLNIYSVIKNKKIAIIGAGISGSTIAKKLSKFNDITIFDKSRGVGGRMATRRTDIYNFDHGTQFFNINTSEFQSFCSVALDNSVIKEWQGKFAKIDNNVVSIVNDQNSYFVPVPRMNSFCKYIIKDLNVLLEKNIIKIVLISNKWSLITDKGEIFDNFDFLFITIPPEQALLLINDNFKYINTIKNIKMLSCFTLMLGLKKTIDVNFDYATVQGSILKSISFNNSKPLRNANVSLVVHSSNEWSDDNIEEPIVFVKQKMLKDLREIIDLDLDEILHQNIHRWRYATSSIREGSRSFFDHDMFLGVCGDWCVDGTVEGAFVSAMDLYHKCNS